MVVINWIIYIYAIFFCVYATILQTAFNIPILVLCFVLLMISLNVKSQQKALPWLRLLLIGCMHYLGQSIFCLPIYLLTLSRDIYKEENRKQPWMLSASYALMYFFNTCMIIGLSDQKMIWIHALTSMLNFTAVALLTQEAYSTVKQSERLRKERYLYARQDSLTGLINYEESHRRLEELLQDKQSLVLILIDCTDLKGMNTTRGFQAGNFILKQMADLLQILFKDSLFIARYGGDEFAIVMPLGQEHHSTASFKVKLDSELPKLTGIQITYGIASYPQDALTKDDLILFAEHNLFMKKRESWLKREEQMLRSEKLRVVGELASGMAHEIRNPLTTIKGFLQISKVNGFNIENWYSLIMDEIDRMSDLTAEFLQFSKPHTIDFRVDSLHDCVAKVISLMESEATRLGHSIHYKESMDPIFVLMDQDKMLQLVLNIVKNACEAMEDSGVIVIELSRDPKNATLIIADNGPGIPSEQLDKIFHPFFTTKAEGTGLGLSICYKIVQDHQGTLEVESELGTGTRFIITFPLSDNDSHIQSAAFI